MRHTRRGVLLRKSRIFTAWYTNEPYVGGIVRLSGLAGRMIHARKKTKKHARFGFGTTGIAANKATK